MDVPTMLVFATVAQSVLVRRLQRGFGEVFIELNPFLFFREQTTFATLKQEKTVFFATWSKKDTCQHGAGIKIPQETPGICQV
jgi:hypothetical protein